jgi:NADH-quinone oxidoreductase subunit E
MLTDEEKREIVEELRHYDHAQGASIEALKIVQRHRGWVSDESLRGVAELLDLTPDELDGIATFYNLIFRQPVGRHVILVCDSISCWVMGADAIRERLIARLGIVPGETTADGRFTLLPVVCLGACDRAPAIMIDDDLHGHLDPGGLDAVLERYK